RPCLRKPHHPTPALTFIRFCFSFFFFKQKTAYEIGLGIPAEPLFRSSVVSQRESVKNDKPTISMSLSHCIHQTLNSKASTRFHSGGLQQSWTLILNTFLFGVIILIANILKRAFSSQLAAKLRNRLLVL